ncbi:GspE/PulE family protein [Stieleria varia]|uniref:Type II secretion system protein E n=1 Tax=Stieleria varia TaxID=2528005 RepID=A0A5C6A0C6_9BACT|nr:GspE/PulE family protein [Stieleria varia]TWT93274.1 Type II secretion system protein E [Stieleria varia]
MKNAKTLAKSITTWEADKEQEEKQPDRASKDNVEFCNLIFAEAYLRGASDIHLEPFEQAFRARVRVDGALLQVAAGPLDDYPQISTRFKVISNLDISERRRPQEGRLRMIIEGRSIDYRVSSVPTLFGEKIVLRVVDASELRGDLTQLGMSQRDSQLMIEAISRQYGMCLVTGPTGSGKTTTLYSAISRLNQLDRNVTTIEDPVEFNVFGINQINVRRDLNMDFPQVLRLLLRQDPDVILVGEIRDEETANVSFQAALTGHMVLSTLHTNDTVSAVARLKDMGVEPFLICSGLNVVLAQRLTRRICDYCKVQINVTEQHLAALRISEKFAGQATFCAGRGCPNCNGSGFKGRVGIFEVLPMSSRFKDMIFKDASIAALREQAIKEGMRPLRVSALAKAAKGLISLEEASLFVLE